MRFAPLGKVGLQCLTALPAWAKVPTLGKDFQPLEATGGRSLFDFITLCPSGSSDATVPIAGSRAGALGVVNLEFAADLDAGLEQLRRLCELGRGRCGALLDGQEVLAAVLGASLDG